MTGAGSKSRPGFGTLARSSSRVLAGLYLGLVVAVPVFFVYWKALSDGPSALWEALTDEEALDAFRLSFVTAALTTGICALFGTIAAFALVRYRFPGRRVLDALVDLPLALPTSVIGLTLAAVLSPQSPVGAWLQSLGLTILFEKPGILIAFVAVTIPFVIRAVQPLLGAVDRAEEEAAMTLGAGPWKRFTAIIFPVIRPGIVAGSALTFARSLGEFGAVVFVAGTQPFHTQVASTYVFARVENFDMRGASAAAIVVLTTSYILLWIGRRLEERALARLRS